MLKSIFQSTLQSTLQPILKSFVVDTLLNPIELLNNKLIAWIDFEDVSKMTITNNKIENILDKSNNARLFINPVASQMPDYDNINKAGKFFDLNLSAPTFLYNDNAFLFNLLTGFRIFAIVQVNTLQNGSVGNILSESPNITSNTYFSTLLQNSDGGTLRNRIGSTYRAGSSFLFTETTTRSNIPTVSDIEYKIISMQDNVTNIKNFSELTETNSTNYTRTGTLTGTNRTTIGALFRDTAVNGFRGFIKQLIVTTNNLTTQELTDLNAWLKSKVPIPQNDFLLNETNGYLLAENDNRLVLG